MVRLLRKKRGQKRLLGQSTLEYAILVVVVIMALVGIQAYLKRGIQGRMRESADQIGDQFSAGLTTSNITSTSHAIVNEEQDAWSTTSRYTAQTSQRTGTESIANYQMEF
jgi:uncharacterized protein (UPF0333 family)